MEFNDLEKFAEQWIGKLKNYYNKDEKELVNLYALKLGEETGELFEQLLAKQNIQREEKLENMDKKGIGEEIADVILSAAVLAKSLNIDIEKELTSKINKNNDRI